MLFSLEPPADTASASAVLSELRWGGRPAIHWTLATAQLASDRLSDPTIHFKDAPARSLTETEDRLVWRALFASGEVLYSL